MERSSADEFRPAKCPSCDSELHVPADHATVACMYWGSAIVVGEAFRSAAVASDPNLLKSARSGSESRYEPGRHTDDQRYARRR
jgi:hypothetical protein